MLTIRPHSSSRMSSILRPAKILLMLVLSACLVLSASLVLSACTAAPAASTPDAAPLPATNTAAPATDTPQPSPTPLPPTSTTAPSATAAPTETPAPSATATPAPLEDTLTAWCLPDGTSPMMAEDPGNPPFNARAASYVNGALEVNNQPSSICVFVYAFPAAVATGMKMEVYEVGQQSPFVTADLVPLEGQPNQAAGSLRHVYVIAPPLWDISYEFAVRDASGSELRRDNVNIHRWKPALCWNGQLPNMNTLRCPLQQDLHPWDAGYGTPMPTLTPEE